MPAFIIAEKCDGCKGRDRTACMYACPNDLMVLDKVTMKAYNRDPWMCWECLCCAKICPQQALTCGATLILCRWAPVPYPAEHR